jgi:hypothetical protein
VGGHGRGTTSPRPPNDELWLMQWYVQIQKKPDPQLAQPNVYHLTLQLYSSLSLVGFARSKLQALFFLLYMAVLEPPEITFTLLLIRGASFLCKTSNITESDRYMYGECNINTTTASRLAVSGTQSSNYCAQGGG